MADFHDSYGFFAKALHYLAFNTSKLQLTLAANESEEYQQQLQSLTVEKPVFIASLPRSGTTILLEILSETGLFCHHTYRDMPFIFTPLMWAEFSRRFAVEDTPRERAHGDGIKINQNSPEAFEEMLFKAFWPEYYKGQSLPVWGKQWGEQRGEQHKDKFELFFVEHIRKLMLRDSRQRYLSKNNLNITRLPYLKGLFPDGCFVVPYREPVQHALSLLKQHQNFCQLHQRNRFAKNYMATIGHFDFGANLKPVNFNDWFNKTRYLPDQLDFWLEYWIACYQHLLATAPFAYFIGFEQYCADPKIQLSNLAESIGIEAAQLLSKAGRIKPAKPHGFDESQLDPDNLATARRIYQDLSQRN